MHDLLLHSPPLGVGRHPQLLSILAGISGMQPAPALEKHLLFRPTKEPTERVSRFEGGSQNVGVEKRRNAGNGEGGELWYLRCVGVREGGALGGRMGEEEEGEGGQGEKMDVDVVEGGRVGKNADGEGKGGKKGVRWTLQFRDLPEVARRERPVTVRGVSDIPIGKGDPVTFMEGMDYRFLTAFYISGHRFTYQNTSILLYRVFIPPPTNNDADLLIIPSATPELGQLLDPSGSYMLQASVRVQDGSKVELINRGVSELQALKETLRGVVELEAGERLAMDTRVHPPAAPKG